MEFEFTDTLWVEPADLDEMVRLCKEMDRTPQDALNEVCCGWDDYDYYRVGAVEDRICAEIERRLKNA